MAIERQIVLECVQPKKNKNKYYEINIIELGNLYKVDCRWGRIEHFKDGNPQSQTKLTHVNLINAMAETNTIKEGKIKKGYKVVKDTHTSVHTDIKFASKSQEKRIKAQTNQPTFDRTEHVEVVVSEWWKHDIIEERVI